MKKNGALGRSRNCEGGYDTSGCRASWTKSWTKSIRKQGYIQGYINVVAKLTVNPFYNLSNTI